jgi:hypothetical protein
VAETTSPADLSRKRPFLIRKRAARDCLQSSRRAPVAGGAKLRRVEQSPVAKAWLLIVEPEHRMDAIAFEDEAAARSAAERAVKRYTNLVLELYDFHPGQGSGESLAVFRGEAGEPGSDWEILDAQGRVLASSRC